MVSAGQASRQFLKIPASLLPTTSPHFLNLFSSWLRMVWSWMGLINVQTSEIVNSWMSRECHFCRDVRDFCVTADWLDLPTPLEGIVWADVAHQCLRRLSHTWQRNLIRPNPTIRIFPTNTMVDSLADDTASCQFFGQDDFKMEFKAYALSINSHVVLCSICITSNNVSADT